MARTFSDADFSSRQFSDGDFQDAPAAKPQNMFSEMAGPGKMGIMAGLMGKAADSEAVQKDILTNEPTGFVGGMVRGLPATAGGTVLGVPGAAAGEALRQGLVGLNAQAGNTEAPSLLQAGGNIAMAAAGQKASEFAAPYIEAGAQKAVGAIGSGVKNALEYAGVNLAGVKQGAYDFAKGAGDLVKQYVGAPPEVGDELAQQARNAISTTISQGEKQYPKLIEAAKMNPAYQGRTFDLQSAVGDKVLEIADSHSFVNTPGLQATPDAGKFWKFAGQVDNLQNASLDQVYGFQKQLNTLAKDNVGTPLGSAFGKLKSAVQSYLGEQVPEIGRANASYAAAKALEDQTGKLTNANDLLGYVGRAYGNEQDIQTKQAIESAAKSVPGLGDAIQRIRAYQAAKSFEPIIRGIPATGYGAAAIFGAGKAIQSGIGMAGGGSLEQGAGLALGALGAGVSSPRLSLAALRAANSAGPGIASGAEKLVKGSAPALSQAFAHMAPESIAAFYNSPGAR